MLFFEISWGCKSASLKQDAGVRRALELFVRIWSKITKKYESDLFGPLEIEEIYEKYFWLKVKWNVEDKGEK